MTSSLIRNSAIVTVSVLAVTLASVYAIKGSSAFTGLYKKPNKSTEDLPAKETEEINSSEEIIVIDSSAPTDEQSAIITPEAEIQA